MPPEIINPKPEIPAPPLPDPILTPPVDTSNLANSTPPPDNTVTQVEALPIEEDTEPAPPDIATHSESPPDDSLPVEDTSIAEESNPPQEVKPVQTASSVPPPDVSYFDKLLEQVKP